MQTFTHCHVLYERRTEKANEHPKDLAIHLFCKIWLLLGLGKGTFHLAGFGRLVCQRKREVMVKER
jgi:hypothetical protein